jgi:hypothetical protein
VDIYIKGDVDLGGSTILVQKNVHVNLYLNGDLNFKNQDINYVSPDKDPVRSAKIQQSRSGLVNLRCKTRDCYTCAASGFRQAMATSSRRFTVRSMPVTSMETPRSLVHSC